MALGDPYASLTDLKVRLGVTNNEHDDRFRTALLVATDGVNGFCHRQFNLATGATARKSRPVGHDLCIVDDFVSVSSIATDETNTGSFSTTWSATDYELYPLNGVVDGEPGWPFWRIGATLQQGRRFPCYRRATVQVTAVWGWAALPAAVPEATLIVAEEIANLKDAPFGVGGYGDFGVIKVRDNPFASRMLKKYQRDAVLVA
jgi:hypothetical protein